MIAALDVEADEVEIVAPHADAEELFEKDDGSRFEAALLDLDLPDAPDGQIVEMVRSRDIPSIVFTADMDTEMRERVCRVGSWSTSSRKDEEISTI